MRRYDAAIRIEIARIPRTLLVGRRRRAAAYLAVDAAQETITDNESEKTTRRRGD